MRRCLALMTTLLLPLCATSLRGERRGQEQGRSSSGLQRVPVAAGSRTNPFEGDKGAVRAGQKLFRRHCAECHGDDARGGGEGPPLDSNRVQRAASGDLFWFLTNGDLGAGMPSWSRLPDARRWQLVSFLKTLRDSSPPAPSGGAGWGGARRDVTSEPRAVWA
jgi:mono/diheme cytochrome c family protein